MSHDSSSDDYSDVSDYDSPASLDNYAEKFNVAQQNKQCFQEPVNTIKEKRKELWNPIFYSEKESYFLSKESNIMKKGIKEGKESGRYISEELYEKVSADKLAFGDSNWHLIKGYPLGGMSVYTQIIQDGIGTRPTGYYKIDTKKVTYFFRRGVGGS